MADTVMTESFRVFEINSWREGFCVPDYMCLMFRFRKLGS